MSKVEMIETPAGPCRLRRSDRRTLAISVLPGGTIELNAPLAASADAICRKVARRLRWIATQQRRFAEMSQRHGAVQYVSGATHRHLGRQYRLKIRVGLEPSVKLQGGRLEIVTDGRQPSLIRARLERWQRQRAERLFAAKLARWRPWCVQHGLPEPRLKLVRMPKRWGSAQPGGAVCLNPYLIKVPSLCIDYVIAHEICHLRHARHDRAFFQLLTQLVPDWQAIKRRLEAAEI